VRNREGEREQTPAGGQSSGEARFDGEVGGLRPFAGVDLLAVGGLHARDLEAPIGADDGEAVAFDRDDFANLAGDAFRILRRQRLGVEDLQLLAVERGPGAGRRIAAADQPVDLLPRLAPVDRALSGRSGPRRSPWLRPA
jgi:hypothetical protein